MKKSIPFAVVLTLLLPFSMCPKKSPITNPKLRISPVPRFVTNISERKKNDLEFSNTGDTTLIITVETQSDSFFTLSVQGPFKILPDSLQKIEITFEPTRAGLVIDSLVFKRWPLPDTIIVLEGVGVSKRDESVDSVLINLKDDIDQLERILNDRTKSENAIKNESGKIIKKAVGTLQIVLENLDKKTTSTSPLQFDDIVIRPEYSHSDNYVVINKRHMNYGIDVFNLNRFHQNTAFSIGSFQRLPNLFVPLAYTSKSIPPYVYGDLINGDTLVFFFNKGFAQIRQNVIASKKVFKKINLAKLDFSIKRLDSTLTRITDGFEVLLSNVDYDFDYKSLRKGGRAVDGNVLGSYLNVLDFLIKYFQYVGIRNEIIDKFIANYLDVIKSDLQNNSEEASYAKLFEKHISAAVDLTAEQHLRDSLLEFHWYKHLSSKSKGKASSLMDGLASFIEVANGIRQLWWVYDIYNDYFRFMSDFYVARDCALMFSSNMQRALPVFISGSEQAWFDKKNYRLNENFVEGGDFIFQHGNKFIFNFQGEYNCRLTNLRSAPIIFEKKVMPDSFRVEIEAFSEEEYESYLQNGLSTDKDFRYYTGLALVFKDSHELYRFEINFEKPKGLQHGVKRVAWEVHSRSDPTELAGRFGKPDGDANPYNKQQPQLGLAFRKEKKIDFNKKVELIVLGKRNKLRHLEISLSYRVDGNEIQFNKFKNDSNVFVIDRKETKIEKGYAVINDSENGRLKAFWKFAELQSQ